MSEKAVLMLEDGLLLEGKSFGISGEAVGEVVFNTSMTGYQEILTDPSYRGQIVCMTYPLIGNYGVNETDVESKRVQVEGFIVKESSLIASSWRAQVKLQDCLSSNEVVAISDVDTRAITRRIRQKGAMKGIISTVDFNVKSLKKKLEVTPSIVGQDLVEKVSCDSTYEWEEGLGIKKLPGEYRRDPANRCVVVIDCGVKLSILRNLKEYFLCVMVVPAKTPLKEILKLRPDALLFSNGPGDPEPVTYVIETAREVIARLKKRELKVAVMGICLGHQLLGLAFGGRAEKLKFGHHGGNHPVKDLESGRIDITAQNHNFVIPHTSIPEAELVPTHINLYDHTPEGARHKKLPLFSVQFHPEAGPGPFDAQYIFGQFARMAQEVQK